VNTRQIATGTILAASLLFGGGAAVADASPSSRPAIDRGTVNCESLENRIEGLSNAIDAMDARRARLEARLADAQADGATRRIRVLEAQIAQVDRVTARLQAMVDRAADRHAALCVVQGT
jgi:hypothetical protein